MIIPIKYHSRFKKENWKQKTRSQSSYSFWSKCSNENGSWSPLQYCKNQWGLEMSLSQPPNQIITWSVLFHIASSATLLQLLQRDLLRLSHRGLTYNCSDWTKTNILWQWSSQGRHFLLWRLSWFLYLKRTGHCCRGKEDCRHACVHGLEDFLYFWKPSRSDRIRLGPLPCMNTSLAQGFSCVQIIFCTSHT